MIATMAGIRRAWACVSPCTYTGCACLQGARTLTPSTVANLRHDGSYHVRFASELAGTYAVSIKIGGMPIVGSPTTLSLTASAIDVSKCELSGSGLSEATAGQRATFCVRCRDSFGNMAVVQKGDEVAFGLTLKGVDGHRNELPFEGVWCGNGEYEIVSAHTPDSGLSLPLALVLPPPYSGISTHRDSAPKECALSIVWVATHP